MPPKEPAHRRDAAQLEALKNHLQLGQPNHGGVGIGSRLAKNRQQRESEDIALESFPKMPEAEKWRLEQIITNYGLPLMQLDTNIAAFIVRRVLRDYNSLTRHKRTVTPLFTVEELQALMAELKTDWKGLAEITGTTNPKGGGKNNNLIWRWLNGKSAPQGTSAWRVNSYIERYVRRKSKPPTARPSENPATVERRERYRKSRQQSMAPVSQLTGKERDAAQERGRD